MALCSKFRVKTGAFISCRGRPTILLTDAARGEEEEVVGEAKLGYQVLKLGDWRD